MGEPQKNFLHWKTALFWHALGFVTLIVLTWADQLFGLFNHLLGEPAQEIDIRETLLKTGIITALWLFGTYKLYKLVSRLSYLENFLIVCAWCRKIEKEENWLSIEEHFEKRTGHEVSHGICPDCRGKFMKAKKVA